ncbi:DUF2660 domain-containing protein [Candidatus Tisiphia endosymbiont of Beris chalybata]|uniref:DUF2660 domain-containing protein n=1 Tax=Candidatus Tisiphia endosymbiont of Beris chalybata TaxID=3066262 RepID=UPI00312C9391
MQNIVLIIGSLLLAVIAIFIYFFYKLRKSTAVSENGQENYPTNTIVYNREVYIKKLSLQERIELSWKFLYEITELIVTKFSTEDKNALNIEGHRLLTNGMKYEHVSELGIKHNVANITTNVEQSPPQLQGFNPNI